MVERVTFRLDAYSDVARLMAEREELRPFEPVVRDLVEMEDFAFFVTEVDYNDDLDENGFAVGGDSRIYVMAFPLFGRAAIVTNGCLVWVDATDTAQAARTYREAA